MTFSASRVAGLVGPAESLRPFFCMSRMGNGVGNGDLISTVISKERKGKKKRFEDAAMITSWFAGIFFNLARKKITLPFLFYFSPFF